MVNVNRYYKTPGLSPSVVAEKVITVSKLTSLPLKEITTESCFYVETQQKLTDPEILQVRWVLAGVLNPDSLTDVTKMPLSPDANSLFIEIGPRLNFSTAFSTNAVSIFNAIGLKKITRVEVSTRYLIRFASSATQEVLKSIEEQVVAALHDRMTQCRYLESLSSFHMDKTPDPWYEVDIVGEGRTALEKVNDHLGLAFDDWDLDYYTELFKNKLKRNPTSVECFDLAQSNSEHSRHWFFKGKMILDGKEREQSLIDMIIDTQNTTNQNNVIKFSDNSSAIIGYSTQNLMPTSVWQASPFHIKKNDRNIIFTAETHNFPTGVAPFSGATTGTGGRIRDVQAVGRGGYVIAGTAGYSFGNLLIPDYNLPWEEANLEYPDNFASPVEVAIEASNGASDYGNKFGEPVISGFARSFGLVLDDKTKERREWIKPIMFSGGIGTMDSTMTDKQSPKDGMQVVKLGGPIYRIGVGGGSASSVQIQGDNAANLDFDAVQRGDAEMEQKLNRVIRSCLELGDKNPICSIHDQGAGGNGNVLKELVEPTGAVIFTKRFQLGDPTLNTLELWGAEYQESDALLCKAEDVPLLMQLAARERCPVSFVGVVTGDGKVVLSERDVESVTGAVHVTPAELLEIQNEKNPVNLDLEFVLGKMPQKEFNLEKYKVILRPLSLPPNLKVADALERVLRLPSVASKRYLTSKVDRSVTGLVAQQQCVGPLHTPLADVAVIALSYFDTVGSATSIGEQPIKGLLCPAAGARMTVAEAMTNLVFAVISDIKDVKCSGNWMWAAKLPGEGAALYEACEAMCKVMGQLGVAVDGGKDSLSMAARVGKDTVKAPGALVVSTYAPCPDIRQVVTPDLKAPSKKEEGLLVFVDLSGGESRLGGSALAQCYKQLGDKVPDLDNPELLVKAFNSTQNLIKGGSVLAGHDVSDGGLITCLLEMAFGGHCGLKVDIAHKSGTPLEVLFAEEVGWVLEVDRAHIEKVLFEFKKSGVPVYPIGVSSGQGPTSRVEVSVEGDMVVDDLMTSLLQTWEQTSHQLEKRQSNRHTAREEFESLANRTGPTYRFSVNPSKLEIRSSLSNANGPEVAVIREEGSNGDREMVASLYMAGFQVWDATMEDIVSGKLTLDRFRGIIFPGGFSYADVLGSAKGWAASFLFDPKVKAQLQHFRNREDTFSFGVCNGCQLLALLQWIGLSKYAKESEEGVVPAVPDVFLDRNTSERYESRFPTVRVEKTSSIMLRGLEGSSLGVWIAHAEGRFSYKTQNVYTQLNQQNCIALRYIDDKGTATETYPMNPNGSQYGVAGIVSKDGKHLAMMPHPERCVLPWQWPHVPLHLREQMTKASPWLKMFHNAYEWCIKPQQ